ncbi:hypothetical protein VIGAN_02282100, partial [Vigna angularis var. angularis]
LPKPAKQTNQISPNNPFHTATPNTKKLNDVVYARRFALSNGEGGEGSSEGRTRRHLQPHCPVHLCLGVFGATNDHRICSGVVSFNRKGFHFWGSSLRPLQLPL